MDNNVQNLNVDEIFEMDGDFDIQDVNEMFEIVNNVDMQDNNVQNNNVQPINNVDEMFEMDGDFDIQDVNEMFEIVNNVDIQDNNVQNNNVQPINNVDGDFDMQNLNVDEIFEMDGDFDIQDVNNVNMQNNNEVFERDGNIDMQDNNVQPINNYNDDDEIRTLGSDCDSEFGDENDWLCIINKQYISRAITQVINGQTNMCCIEFYYAVGCAVYCVECFIRNQIEPDENRYMEVRQHYTGTFNLISSLQKLALICMCCKRSLNQIFAFNMCPICNIH